MSDLVIKDKIITKVTGSGLPLPKDGQTTDDILPAGFLNEITFNRMGEYAYFNHRYVEGNLDQINPAHVMNQEAYAHARILFGGEEYGTGSSREHAPQGLYRWGEEGIRAIVAKSLADLFTKNCQNIGIVGVTIAPEDFDMLVSDVVYVDPSTKFEVNLEDKTLSYEGGVFDIDMPEERRQAFLTGTWDVLDVLMKYQDRLAKKEKEIAYLNWE